MDTVLYKELHPDDISFARRSLAEKITERFCAQNGIAQPEIHYFRGANYSDATFRSSPMAGCASKTKIFLGVDTTLDAFADTVLHELRHVLQFGRDTIHFANRESEAERFASTGSFAGFGDLIDQARNLEGRLDTFRIGTRS
ncbi:MAG: hypothetical protein JW793_08935 [Acidobacteria bacterium]|nr:hypothetical protein [Acidobacteriota bacterium]